MIVLTTSSFPSHPDDYRGRFVLEFANHLAELSPHPVNVLVPDPPGITNEPTAFRTTPLSATPFSPFGRSGLPQNIIRDPLSILGLGAALQSLKRTLRQRYPERHLTVAHWLLPFGSLCAREDARTSKPTWIVCHSGGVHLMAKLPPPVRQRLLAPLDRPSAHLSFTTEDLRETFHRAAGPSASRFSTSILPMGIDTSPFRANEPNKSGPIALLGRLVPIKGFDLALEAVSLFQQKTGETIAIRVIGGGVQERSLRALATRLELNVEWLGECSPSAAARALDGCSLAIIPSRT
ncbi:MAG: glycosyltransferase, partial [Myxococcales bacterium]|nr:glycosyltransferase [Myxococcales bacterium]